MSYILRNYQTEAVEKSLQFLRDTKIKHNGIVVLPTGSGKSLVIAEIARQLGEPIIIFQPSKEILEQNYLKLCSYGVLDCSIYSASMNQKRVSKITFATIGSVINNAGFFEHFKYIIVDECHFVNSEKGMYKDFFETVKSKILGLTATPYRLSSNGMGSQLRFITRTRPHIFKTVLYYSQTRDLLEQGHLSPMEYYKINLVDTKQLKVNTTGSDYTERSVKIYYKAVNFKEQVLEIINRLIAAKRKNILVFTRFVEEAEYIAWRLGPEVASTVSGETPKKEREKILADFKEGRTQVVANVGVLTTGFDFPELETVVIARPTMSLALYYQMTGRAIRPHKDKKAAWVVDLCRTYERFGKIEDLHMKQSENGLFAIYSKGRQLTNTILN
jgi:DNA repair protein RadD